MRWGLAFGCFAAAIGIAALLGTCTKVVPAEKEFICTDDAAVVERHVGVKSAVIESTGKLWWIDYTDGTRAKYAQAERETCSVEIVNQ